MKTIATFLLMLLCFFACDYQENFEDIKPPICTTKVTKLVNDTITIHLYNLSIGTELYYYVFASAPVKTRIEISQYVHFNEYDYCEKNLLYDGNILIFVELDPGQQEAYDHINISQDYCTTISLNVLGTPTTSWKDQIIDGVKYQLSGRWS